MNPDPGELAAFGLALVALLQLVIIAHLARRPPEPAPPSQGQEIPAMPVSDKVTAALGDLGKSAQAAVDAAYKQGQADAMAGFTDAASQDDADTAAAIEGAAGAIGALTPTKPAA